MDGKEDSVSRIPGKRLVKPKAVSTPTFGGGAIKVGDRLPEFSLGNTDGATVHSTELLGKGAVVLTVFRGKW